MITVTSVAIRLHTSTEESFILCHLQLKAELDNECEQFEHIEFSTQITTDFKEFELLCLENNSLIAGKAKETEQDVLENGGISSV